MDFKVWGFRVLRASGVLGVWFEGFGFWVWGLRPRFRVLGSSSSGFGAWGCWI